MSITNSQEEYQITCQQAQYVFCWTSKSVTKNHVTVKKCIFLKYWQRKKNIIIVFNDSFHSQCCPVFPKDKKAFTTVFTGVIPTNAGPQLRHWSHGWHPVDLVLLTTAFVILLSRKKVWKRFHTIIQMSCRYSTRTIFEILLLFIYLIVNKYISPQTHT